VKHIIDLRLVRLDDGALKGTIMHEGVPHIFNKEFATARDACLELSMILKMLPLQDWFAEVADEE